MSKFNLYGDSPDFLAGGLGADIASQRADDLDQMAIDRVIERSGAQTLVFAVDIACGAGGQAIRMAREGAEVLALDLMDMSAIVGRAVGAVAGLRGKVTFKQFDMCQLDEINLEVLADVIICQRAIHYLEHSAAISVVMQMARLLAPDGRLYLSASGIHSELGCEYAGRSMPLKHRYTELAPKMRDKHNIHGSVCLYSEEDLSQLLIKAGLKVDIVFSSAFGNIKAVATHVSK